MTTTATHVAVCTDDDRPTLLAPAAPGTTCSSCGEPTAVWVEVGGDGYRTCARCAGDFSWEVYPLVRPADATLPDDEVAPLWQDLDLLWDADAGDDDEGGPDDRRDALARLLGAVAEGRTPALFHAAETLGFTLS